MLSFPLRVRTWAAAAMPVLQRFGGGIYRETTGGMDLLSRRLEDGRVISIDSVDGAMFERGGHGLAHLDMNTMNNRVRRRPRTRATTAADATCRDVLTRLRSVRLAQPENLRWVTLDEAVELLRSFGGGAAAEEGDAPPAAHTVQAVFDDGDDVGFVYTVGLHDIGRAELLCDPVGRDDVVAMANHMNFLADRNVLPGQTTQLGADADSPRFRIRCPLTREWRTLMRTKACQCDEGAALFILEPLT